MLEGQLGIAELVKPAQPGLQRQRGRELAIGQLQAHPHHPEPAGAAAHAGIAAGSKHRLGKAQYR